MTSIFRALKKTLLSRQYSRYCRTLKNATAIDSNEFNKFFYPWLLSLLIPASKNTKILPALCFSGKKTILGLATRNRKIVEYGPSLLSKFLEKKFPENLPLHELPNNHIDLLIINKEIPIDLFIQLIMYKINASGSIVFNNYHQSLHSELVTIALRHGYTKDLETTSIDIGRESFSTTCIFKRYSIKYAINEIESELDQYLNFNNGFYIEAGANDGVVQSNTLNLSIKRGWRGLLIEPTPKLARECHLNRPYDIVECAALVEPKISGSTLKLQYANLMTTTRSAFQSNAEFQNHIKLGCEIQGNLKTHEFSAIGLTLNQILKKHSVDSVDFLSLDIEGNEAFALQGLDFSTIKPKYILVECRYPEEVFKILNSHYILLKKITFHDYLFKEKFIPTC